MLPQAIEYFRYYFLGVISVVLYNICTGIMNAVGDSRRPLFYLIFSSLTNVALDLLFIGVFHWGVWSAAVATTLAQTTSTPSACARSASTATCSAASCATACPPAYRTPS